MAVRRVEIDDRVAPAKRQAERALERDEQARTMRVGNDFEPRLSRADEQRMSDEIREREDAEAHQRILEQNARLARDVQQVLMDADRLADGLGSVDKRTRKDLQQIRSLLGRIRDRRTLPC